MKCPLRVLASDRPNEGYIAMLPGTMLNCLEEECAWYRAEEERCAIFLIFDRLDRIDDSLNEINNRLAEIDSNITNE